MTERPDAVCVFRDVLVRGQRFLTRGLLSEMTADRGDRRADLVDRGGNIIR